ncbi:3-deoxy-D-manno-octulosonic acid transferase [Parvicella tangerina]|uniref:3-deoxy-D-manno-octulosonic acid transferase n=1 Tax=Parvicella tangerina TaxID=2829795 RepID=A0A916JK57_9FLAO|nr:glycosyltransferase N-terminal domain-containing protein [Parvicella tangerina]CAG5077933.1 3-deoxy-D-manno-octulosonic acid transferase [Parvicella tangerina]
MLKPLYNIGIRAYKLGVLTAGLMGSSKAIKWIEGRKNWLQKLKESKLKNVVWIHASSMGEFEMAKPLIELFRESPKFKNEKILVTFFSPSGYEMDKDYPLVDGVFYIPLDTKQNAQKFIHCVSPKLAIFVKYDFWFNFLETLQSRKIPTLFFSSNFREGQFYFKSGSKWQRQIMQKIDSILCINTSSENVLTKNGFSNAGICGDTRFDKVIQNAERCVPIPLIELFAKNCKILIAGSSWPIEEELIANYLSTFIRDDLKLIIAPHDIAENHLIEIEQKIERGLTRYSRLNKDNISTTKIILIDNIGMLSNLYQYGDIAFIGGGFTNALHNILEACAMGNALIYGGNIKKYPEGIELAQEGGSFSIKEEDFDDALNKLLDDPALLSQCQKQCKEFVYKHQGATNIVFEKAMELIS